MNSTGSVSAGTVNPVDSLLADTPSHYVSTSANHIYEYGIVSIKPQSVDYETPMSPITIMRNALGVNEGGSGIPLDREAYMKSVQFWQKHAAIS